MTIGDYNLLDVHFFTLIMDKHSENTDNIFDFYKGIPSILEFFFVLIFSIIFVALYHSVIKIFQYLLIIIIHLSLMFSTFVLNMINHDNGFDRNTVICEFINANYSVISLIFIRCTRIWVGYLRFIMLIWLVLSFTKSFWIDEKYVHKIICCWLVTFPCC